MPKWVVIQNLVSMGNIFLITLIVVTTLITLFYYVRTSFGAFMLTYRETLWNSPASLNRTSNTIALILSIWSTLGLLVISLIYRIF
jgi:NADH-ubiquinone oxidoreductase chain 2